jgi:ergothioneine biosynthesis protein EgtB
MSSVGSCDQRYQTVRAFTEHLAAPLSAEDQMIQTMPDVSPTKWHRAHVTWFFEEFVLVPHAPRYAVYDETFSYLFNSYYEAVGDRWLRDRRGLIARPNVAQVAEYRKHVDAAMTDLLAKPTTADVEVLTELGLHHEQQHQELLLMDIKHVLAQQHGEHDYAQDGARSARSPSSRARPQQWIAFDAGLADIGHDYRGFAFDNEGPMHKVWLESFEIADRLVTCGEWRAFIEDGGYQKPTLWLSDGWHTVNQLGWTAPLYWTRRDGEWVVTALDGTRVVDDGAPVVHVSFYEADAFARWAGARLPTEFEWERAAVQCGASDDDRSFTLQPTGGRDVMARACEWFGQVWQWTSSAYLPYPRFAPSAGAVGEYNGKFMSNQMVLRGSACITPVGHARPTYRNFFGPASRWMFGGLRLARSS